METLFFEYFDAFIALMNANALARAQQFINELKVWHVLAFLLFGYVYAGFIMWDEQKRIDARFNRAPDDWS
jgi:hypothetical protein